MAGISTEPGAWPIPDDLTERYEVRNGQLTKVPYQPNGLPASTTNASTYHSFEEVMEAIARNRHRFDGIGYVFTENDPYAGIDLDKCLDGDGNPLPWAQPIILGFSDTYMEKSPSGEGVKIFARGKLSGKGKRKDFGDHVIEIYDQGRFFTVTGNVFRDAPRQIEDHQADIERLYKQISSVRNSNGNDNGGTAAKINEKIPRGHRHNSLVSLAGSMRRRGMSVDEIDAALQVVNSKRCEPPYDRDHVRKIAESAGGWTPDANSGRAHNLLSQPFTDTGNAERLIALYGRDIRFCAETKKWFVWDGRRWNSEDTRRIKMLAKQTTRHLYAAAAGIDDAEIREATEKFARKSESASAIQAMLTCAEYEEGVPIRVSELDQNTFLLNCLNGTLDVTTGELREHRREDLITKLVHFNYHPDARCPRFLQFLERIMGGPSPNESEPTDEQRQSRRERVTRLMTYLQKCFGYALTADVSEKAVFCLFGSGNNGKTTLLEAVRFVVSEYSTQILIDSLMQHHTRESNASLADLSDLRGARFVTMSEAEEGQRLAIAKLKYLTQGGGEIKSCRKWENPIQFRETHKLFLDANHRPIIRGAEKAVWNRLKLVPFTVTIDPDEIDKSLAITLKSEAGGILAWMVKGCQDWLNEGLGDPPEVAEATAAWHAESDRFPAFLEEKCIVENGSAIPVSQFWSAYQSWCEVNKERSSLNKTAFDERLKELGLKQGKNDDGKVRVWRGIRFRTVDDERRDTGTEEDVKS
jgi:putative DNA primase/helicase